MLVRVSFGWVNSKIEGGNGSQSKDPSKKRNASNSNKQATLFCNTLVTVSSCDENSWSRVPCHTVSDVTLNCMSPLTLDFL